MLTLAYHVQITVLRLIGQVKYQLLERRFRYTLHISLIVTTLVMAVAVAALTSQRSEALGLAVVGLVAAVLLLVVLYHHMEFGVALLMIATTILNPPLPYNITVMLLLLISLTVLWLLKLLIVQRSFQSLVPTAVNWTSLFFIIAVIIAYVWSSIYVDPLVRPFQEEKALPRFTTGLVMILSPMAMLLFAHFLRSTRTMQRMIWYFIVYGAIVVGPIILGIKLPPFLNYGGQLSTWVPLFAFGQLVFNDELKRVLRIFVALVVLAWVYMLVGLGFNWLSGWVPLVTGLVIQLLMRSRRFIILVGLGAALFIASNTDFLQSAFEDERRTSGDTRLDAASGALDIAGKHFLFGTGPTGYYFYLISSEYWLFQLSHNNYVDIFAQTGLVGFTAWMLLWGSVGWTVWRMFR
jgi:hypothetical protein